MADAPSHTAATRAANPGAADASPAAPADRKAVRALLIDELGRWSAEEKERLSSGVDPAFVENELVKLQQSKKWIVSLGAVMLVIAIALPVFRLHNYILETDPMTSYMLMGQIAFWSGFAALQAVIPVYIYLNWKRRRTIFRALHALTGPASTGASTSSQPTSAAADTSEADPTQGSSSSS